MASHEEPDQIGDAQRWRRTRLRPGLRNSDGGVVITLLAVFMLFVTGAMAALSIDLVTIYTARSEAQLAADSAALAAARVLANSGVTSPGGTGVAAAADSLAQILATQVASQNQVGGTNQHFDSLLLVNSASSTFPNHRARSQSPTV
jgi:Putative Flp pilus-assembly TadE/G-like